MKIIEKAKEIKNDVVTWVRENPNTAIACAIIGSVAGSFVGGYVVAGKVYDKGYDDGFHDGTDSFMNSLYSEAKNHGGLCEDNFKNKKNGSRMNLRCTILENER